MGVWVAEPDFIYSLAYFTHGSCALVYMNKVLELLFFPSLPKVLAFFLHVNRVLKEPLVTQILNPLCIMHGPIFSLVHLVLLII